MWSMFWFPLNASKAPLIWDVTDMNIQQDTNNICIQGIYSTTEMNLDVKDKHVLQAYNLNECDGCCRLSDLWNILTTAAANQLEKKRDFSALPERYAPIMVMWSTTQSLFPTFCEEICVTLTESSTAPPVVDSSRLVVHSLQIIN